MNQLPETVEVPLIANKSQPTVAKMRVYEGGQPEIMKLGFNSLALGYLSLEAVQQFIAKETGSSVSEPRATDASVSPFVDQEIEIAPPLSASQLEYLGIQMTEGAFTYDEPAVEPEAVLLVDSRGNYWPNNHADNGNSVQGGSGIIAQERLPFISTAA